MKSNLDLKVEGVSGNGFKQHNSKGAIKVIVDSFYLGPNNVITFDAFSGRGDTYKRADHSLICIETGEKCIFNGTFEELIVKLQK